MKTSLYSFFSFLLVFFTLITSPLKANPTAAFDISTVECNTATENLLIEPLVVDACYGPGWQNTYNINQTSCTWSWAGCDGAWGYSVQWRYPNGTWYNYPGICYQTWVNVTGLNPCTAYEWRVRTCCYNGYNSSWCYPNYFSTLCNYCEQPWEVYTTDITQNSAKLHWSTVWGAENYTVQIKWPNGSWTYLPDSPCATNWITVYGLQPGKSYEWRVKANCSYNSSSNWSYSGYFTTPGSYCYNPSWLQCNNITGYSATWKWEGVYDADYYWVQWRYPGGTWYDLNGGPCYGTWVNVNWLQPCTTYEWRVKSHCYYGYNNNWCNPYTFTTTCNACAPPYTLITKDIGNNQATFKWSSVYGAQSYSVQIRDINGQWYDVPGSPTTGLWITAFNLTPCKTYEWRVRTNCSYYETYSYWSKPKAFSTTCGSSCNSPEWVNTTGISPNSVTLHWAAVSGADYYVIEWRLPGGSWYELPGPWTNTYAEFTGLYPNTSYEFHVKTHCAGGQYSYWSPVGYFNTGSGASCGLPFFRYTLPITDSTATFHWSSVPGALSYTVQLHEINGPWVEIANSPTVDTFITAKNLAPNTQYEWRMQVNCSNNAHSYWLSPIMFSSGVNGSCGTPGSLYADNISLNAATLNWAGVAGAETYSVEIRLLPSGAWNPVPGSPVDSTAVVVDGLSPYTTYEWRVRANCTGGYHGIISNAVQFTTSDINACVAPTGLASNNITETTSTFSWRKVQGAIGYHVQTRLPNGSWVDFSGGLVNDTTVLMTGFTPNTTYEWRVRTACAVNQYSNWSLTGTFITLGAGPISDDCTNARLLTVENSCVTTFASTIDATPTSPAPVGGCYANAYKDVWFKFVMPDVPSPAVTIRTTQGSLANAVMEVYTGPDCNVMSFIACEDNNDNGNGSSMPVINLTGTPNATIWVRVWGYDGSEGTFSICVFNGVSVNYSTPTASTDPVDGASLDELDKLGTTTEIRVSPNPVNDQLNIEVRQTNESRVIGLRLIDLSGKAVIVQDVKSSDDPEFHSMMNVSNLSEGIYIIQIQTTNGIYAEKISVIK